jgi:hypothetical protein
MNYLICANNINDMMNDEDKMINDGLIISFFSFVNLASQQQYSPTQQITNTTITQYQYTISIQSQYNRDTIRSTNGYEVVMLRNVDFLV